jgi:epoxyqueuosine reductase
MLLQDDRHALAGEIRRKARELGFDLVGVAPAEPSRYRGFLREWLDDGRHGTMEWLAHRLEERTDVRSYLPDCRSVICVATNYYVPLASQSTATAAPLGRVARYALGDDYHELLKDRLHHLSDWLKARVPGVQTRCAVDTAPVLERELAARTGVGWIGKNTCVINEAVGSWLLLGEMMTTLDLPHDEPAQDRCGSCTRCLDACPTQALQPYKIDARRCISYLTIESRDPIPINFQPAIGDWLFGCDICQEVCPWNRQPPTAAIAELQPRFAGGGISVDELTRWSAIDYQHSLRRSAMKRVKLPVLQRNASIVRKNLAQEEPR